MNLKKILAMLLAVVMLLSFAACGETKDEGNTNPVTTEPQQTEPQETEPQVTTPQLAEVNFFTMSITDADGVAKSLYASPNGDEENTVYVDFVDAIIKRGNVADGAMEAITNTLASSGLVELDGKNEGEPSEVNASMYVTLTDGSDISADFYGEIPEAFLNGYAAMKACFDTLTADMEEYVPQPMEMGEIADSDRAALDVILESMDLQNADNYVINGIAKDEFFGPSLGLSFDEGIASGLSFSSQMMAVAYSLNIVTLAEGTDAEAVAKDFETNIDWTKWLCVQPTDALIATNGNQVLCLLGSDDFFDMSAAAIEDAGWTTYTTLDNPNM